MCSDNSLRSGITMCDGKLRYDIVCGAIERLFDLQHFDDVATDVLESCLLRAKPKLSVGSWYRDNAGRSR